MPRDKPGRERPKPKQPHEFSARLEKGLPVGIIPLNEPPRGLAKMFALHFGPELYGRLRQIKENQS